MLYTEGALDPIRRIATALHGPCEVEFVDGEITVTTEGPLVLRWSLAMFLAEVADQVEWSVQQDQPCPAESSDGGSNSG